MNQTISRHLRTICAVFVFCVGCIAANAQAKIPAAFPHFGNRPDVAPEAVQAKKMQVIQLYPTLSKIIATDKSLSAEYSLTEADYASALPISNVQPNIALAQSEITAAQLAAMSPIEQAEVRANTAAYRILNK